MPTVKKRGEAPPPISDVLVELAGRRSQLDTLDTHISELIKRVEEGLRKHFSTRVTADMSDEWGVAGTHYTALVYCKLDGKWQLTIESGVIGNELMATMVPLLSAPRETRTRVFTEGHIERLVRGAVDQLDEQIAERQKAITDGTELAQALDGIPF